MLNLRFYKNTSKVYVGDLYLGERRLLATTHPATIAAAVVALAETELEVRTHKGSTRIGFPVGDSDIALLHGVSDDDEMSHFIDGLAKFSMLLSFPLPWDDQAEIHFRTAVHHLPPELVKVTTDEPAPADFKKQLKKRNQYIYYPDC
ncbi:hypothetical protein WN982_03265 [Paraburkholderia sp. IMGN_8]|uniref:hypothetical protein n=1 Tax=Paraburkholderia sp. IMGN_8 TaxID=3136564 RepID=UPI003101B416